MGQVCLHHQVSQASKDSFKLGLPGEGDEVLSNREEPGAGDVLGTIRETRLKCLKGN